MSTLCLDFNSKRFQSRAQSSQPNRKCICQSTTIFTICVKIFIQMIARNILPGAKFQPKNIKKFSLHRSQTNRHTIAHQRSGFKVPPHQVLRDRVVANRAAANVFRRFIFADNAKVADCFGHCFHPSAQNKKTFLFSSSRKQFLKRKKKSFSALSFSSCSRVSAC